MLVLAAGVCNSARTDARIEQLEIRHSPVWRRPYFVVGLTGGIGAGKSSVAQAFERAGATVLDADEVARDVLQSSAMRHNLIGALGPEIIEGDQVSRERIAKLVFADEGKRKRLNGLIHPEVRRRFAATLAALADGVVLVYDVPLLYEAGLDATGDFDLTVVVTAPFDTRVARAKGRSGWSQTEFESRDAAQMPLLEKEKRADVLIRNIGSQKDLEGMADRLLMEIKAARRKK